MRMIQERAKSPATPAKAEMQHVIYYRDDYETKFEKPYTNNRFCFIIIRDSPCR